MLPSELASPDFYPPRDRAGAVVPHRIGLPTWLRVVPSLLRFFNDRIPQEFWFEDLDDDGEFQIVISCPCGEQPKLSFGGMAPCQCDRCFLHDGKEVRVGRESDS